METKYFRRHWYYGIFFISTLSLFFILLGEACKKNDSKGTASISSTSIVPTIKITQGMFSPYSLSITTHTYYLSNVVVTLTNMGSSPLIAAGLCWGASPITVPNSSNGTCASAHQLPTVALPIIFLSGGSLSASTLYYVSAYATNSAGTAYSNAISFTTPP